MPHDDQADVTALLNDFGGGDAGVAGRLMPLLYDELRDRAAGYLRRERPGHTLQPTALAHEAYLKLADQRNVEWQGRAHFMAVAATAMRRILADHARARGAAKRGGGAAAVSLSGVGDPRAEAPVDALALHDVLTKLEETDPELSRLVELRFLGGLTVEETAHVLGVSRPTVERHWRVARAWLSAALRDAAEEIP